MHTHILRSAYLLILFLYFSTLTVAENTSGTPMRAYTISDGLYNNQARHVMELPNGRILVMTDGMPCLYDGTQFHPMNYDQNKNLKVESFFNTDHYFDRSGLVWIRNLHQLSVYNTKTLKQVKAKNLLAPSGLLDRQLRTFFIDDYGNAWLHMSDDNLYIYDWHHPARRVLSTTERNVEGITPSVCDIVQAGRQVFIILSDGKMTCWDHVTHKIRYTIRIEEQTVAFKLKALGWNAESFILRTTRGLYLFNTSTREKHLFYSDAHIQEMKHTADGSLWICSLGLTQFDRQLRMKRHIEQAYDQASGKALSDFCCITNDRLGGIWACTTNSGVGYLSPADPVVSFHPVTNGEGAHVSVNCISRINNQVFVGTSNGLYTLSPQSNELEYYPGGIGLASCKSLRADPDGKHLWITTGQGEIHRLDTQTGKADSYLPSNVERLWGNIPFCIDCGGGTFLTAVRMNRLSLFTPTTHQLDNLTERFPELLQFRNIVDAVKVKGGIIVGTQNGFFFFDTKNKSVKPDRLKALNNNAYSDKCNCMMANADGTVWIGTQNGLLRYNVQKDTFTRMAKSDGLPNSCILSLAKNSDKSLWVATVNGIALITPSGKFQFGEADGLAEPNLNERAACILPDGRAIFGATNGFYIADLRRLRMPKTELKPQIMTASFMGDSVSNYVRSVEVAYDQNNLRFLVSALNYIYPQHMRYRYRLQGAETEWNECMGTKGNIAIVYSLLQPGKYVLEVQCAFQDNPWSSTLRLPIRVLPPWWQTWWAWTLYVLFAVGLCGEFIHQYIRARNRRLDYLRRMRIQHDQEELNKDRLRFFTNITHELRTPLTLILSPVEDLYEDPSLSEHARKSVASIRNSSKRLLHLVEQLLEFRKIEQKGQKLNLKKDHLDTFVLDVYNQFTSNNKNTNIQFAQEVDHVGMNVWFDANVVQTILVNLLSNAVKYTPGGVIRMRLTNEGDKHVILSVSDTGYGIPASALPHIFERYYQVNDKHQASGTGIGLALSKSLAELHHAELTVKSQVKVGSTFSLIFSRAELEHPQSMSLPDTPKDTNPTPDATGAMPAEDKSAVTENEKSEPINASTTNKNLVLIVEDNDDIRQYIADSLDGFDCIQAHNGREGLQLAKQYIPDFIVSDIMMPEMDGNEMCRLIRQDVNMCHIPIIMLTAKSSMDAIEEGYESGAAAYLTKPFTAKMLTALLHNLVLQRTHLLERMLHNSQQQVGSSATSTAQTTTQETSSETSTSTADAALLDDDSADELTHAKTKLSNLTPMDQKFMDKFNRIIEENIDNSELDILYLCDKMAMSRTSLYRKVKGLLGISANEYIRKLRLRRAYQMLQSERYSENTIASIAYDCGFSSVSYFRSCFKEEFGCLPGEVQKR